MIIEYLHAYYDRQVHCNAEWLDVDNLYHIYIIFILYLVVIGRKKEIDTLRGFLVRHLCASNGGVMLVTGPPGTGKTLTVDHVIDTEVCRLTLERVFLSLFV